MQVRLAVNRNQDFRMNNGRAETEVEYDIGFDADGKIHALEMQVSWARALLDDSSCAWLGKTARYCPCGGLKFLLFPERWMSNPSALATEMDDCLSTKKPQTVALNPHDQDACEHCSVC